MNADIILYWITKHLMYFQIWGIKFCAELWSTEVSDYRGCYTKVLVNDILVGLERILDYAGVGLEKFDCRAVIYSNKSSMKVIG